MTERKTAAVFTEATDRMLRERGSLDHHPIERELGPELALAAELAACDWSDESAVRLPLRRRILAGDVPAARHREPRLPKPVRRPRRAAVAAVAAALLALFVLHPTLRAAVVRPALVYLARIVVGERSEAVAVGWPPDEEIRALLEQRRRDLEAGVRWTLETATGTAGGDVPEGAEPVIRIYNSFRTAADAAPFRLRRPGSLPEGYEPEKVALTPSGSAVLFYRAPGRRLSIQETPLRPDRATTHMTMGGDAALDRTDVGGTPAVWLGGDTLVWQRDGIEFRLEGAGLTLDKARRIARSMH